MLSGKALLLGYQQAGPEFLADRLQGMFNIIETKEDVALHNVVLQEVLKMLGSDKETQKRFYQILSNDILAQKAKISLLRKVVNTILAVAKG
jgi:hypothetical protein